MDFHSQLEILLANRRSPETRALFLTLLKYVEGRVRHRWARKYQDLLSHDDLEEIVSEIGMKLMTGALNRFRGNSPGELYAYVRTISDRSLNHAAHSKLRERDAMAMLQLDDLAITTPQNTEIHAECPLAKNDQEYIEALLLSGSKAHYARQNGQSRAAVTRMVQRIQGRIEALSEDEQITFDVWIHQKAREALDEQVFQEAH